MAIGGDSGGGSAAPCQASPPCPGGCAQPCPALLGDGTDTLKDGAAGGPERVTGRAPPSRHIAVLPGDLPGSPCWLCPSQTKTAAAFQTAASSKVCPRESRAVPAPATGQRGGESVPSPGRSPQPSGVPVRGCSACLCPCTELVWALGAGGEGGEELQGAAHGARG